MKERRGGVEPSLFRDENVKGVVSSRKLFEAFPGRRRRSESRTWYRWVWMGFCRLGHRYLSR